MASRYSGTQRRQYDRRRIRDMKDRGLEQYNTSQDQLKMEAGLALGKGLLDKRTSNIGESQAELGLRAKHGNVAGIEEGAYLYSDTTQTGATTIGGKVKQGVSNLYENVTGKSTVVNEEVVEQARSNLIGKGTGVTASDQQSVLGKGLGDLYGQKVGGELTDEWSGPAANQNLPGVSLSRKATGMKGVGAGNIKLPPSYMMGGSETSKTLKGVLGEVNTEFVSGPDGQTSTSMTEEDLGTYLNMPGNEKQKALYESQQSNTGNMEVSAPNFVGDTPTYTPKESTTTLADTGLTGEEQYNLLKEQEDAGAYNVTQTVDAGGKDVSLDMSDFKNVLAQNPEALQYQQGLEKTKIQSDIERVQGLNADVDPNVQTQFTSTLDPADNTFEGFTDESTSADLINVLDSIETTGAGRTTIEGNLKDQYYKATNPQKLSDQEAARNKQAITDQETETQFKIQQNKRISNEETGIYGERPYQMEVDADERHAQMQAESLTQNLDSVNDLTNAQKNVTFGTEEGNQQAIDDMINATKVKGKILEEKKLKDGASKSVESHDDSAELGIVPDSETLSDTEDSILKEASIVTGTGSEKRKSMEEITTNMSKNTKTAQIIKGAKDVKGVAGNLQTITGEESTTGEKLEAGTDLLKREGTKFAEKQIEKEVSKKVGKKVGDILADKGSENVRDIVANIAKKKIAKEAAKAALAIPASVVTGAMDIVSGGEEAGAAGHEGDEIGEAFGKAKQVSGLTSIAGGVVTAVGLLANLVPGAGQAASAVITPIGMSMMGYGGAASAVSSVGQIGSSIAESKRGTSVGRSYKKKFKDTGARYA